MKTFTLLVAIVLAGLSVQAADPVPIDYTARFKEIADVAKSARSDNRELKKLLGESVSINQKQALEVGDLKSQIIELSATMVRVQNERDKAVSNAWEMFWKGAGVATVIWLALYLARRSKSPPVKQPVRVEEPPHPSNRRRGRKQAARK